MKRIDPIALLENTILNNAGFSIIVTNPQGVIQYFSTGAEKMLGYAVSEVIGLRSLIDLHDPNDFAEDVLIKENPEDGFVDRPFDIARLGAYMDAKEDFICSYITKDGNRVPVRMSFICMKGLDEVLLGYIAIAKDITAQKRSEESLYRVADRLQLATLAAKMGIWDYDIVEDQLVWDKTVFQLFGASMEDGTPEWIWENRIHPEDKSRVLEIIHAALQREFLFEHEFRVIWPDASVHTIKSDALVKRDVDGKAVRLIGTNRDITKQKAESEQLRLLSSVITNTNEVIIITDAEPINGVFPSIRYVNQAFENLTGYSAEEVIGHSPRMLQGPKSDKKALRRLKQAMQDWEPCEIETINYKKSGEEFWVKLSVFPVSDQNGWYTHWVSIQSDVTARKQAELEREQMISELTKNNRELQQFSYITTHNLRAPLTNLIAISNLLDTTTIEDPALAELIEGFKTSAHQLHTTLDDLIQVLLIKGDTSMDLELVEFEDIFDRVILTIQSMVQQSGAQFATYFDEATSVYFSTNYMESIFLNLISNSIKFAHPKRKPRIRIQSFKEAQTVKLIFSDNGIGFDMERVKDRIFGLHKRFHKGEGKGVGLFLIHSQITALGGTIEVESQENVGTAFTITFKQDPV